MIKKAFWTGWMVVLWISTAFADGDGRHATPLEKTFALKVLTTFETALPQGPEGWSKVEKTDLKPPEIVVQGQETFPMQVDYHIQWQNDKRIQAAKAEMDRMLMKQAQKQASDTKMEDYTADLEKLAQEFGQAIEAKDTARAEALQKEMEALGKRINEKASGDNQALDQQIRDLTPHDVELKVDLSANVFYQGFVRIPSEQAVLEGCPVVRMDHEDHTSQGWHEGATYVFVGDFSYVREENTASMQADEIPGAPSTKVRTVVIRVSGEKERALGIIKQINLKAIKALLAGRWSA